MKLIFYMLGFVCWTAFSIGHIDVTVIGNMRFAASVARRSIIFIDNFKDYLTMNFILCKGHKIDFKDIPPAVKKIAQSPDKTPGKVALFFGMVWDRSHTYARAVPKECPLKIAYSVLETTAIPKQWVTIFNSQFDAVVVPDEFLVPVYERCGVKVPVFVLPEELYLDPFLARPLKTKRNPIFTFGCSAAFYPWKNFELLINAFAKEFKQDPAVKLVVHSRGGNPSTERKVRSLLNTLKAPNISLIKKSFAYQDYISFLAGLDAYVLLSKGEGFSITPREALALGIPCILSNNSAHTTICNSGFALPVPALQKERAYYAILGGYTVGYNFNSTVEDVRKALRTLYTNYESYLKKTGAGREWVKQYNFVNLKSKYLSLVKPKKVILGDKNILGDDFIMTKSPELYKKYRTIFFTKGMQCI